jgi:hypothetical protein
MCFVRLRKIPLHSKITASAVLPFTATGYWKQAHLSRPSNFGILYVVHLLSILPENDNQVSCRGLAYNANIDCTTHTSRHCRRYITSELPQVNHIQLISESLRASFDSRSCALHKCWHSRQRSEVIRIPIVGMVRPTLVAPAHDLTTSQYCR